MARGFPGTDVPPARRRHMCGPPPQRAAARARLAEWLRRDVKAVMGASPREFEPHSAQFSRRAPAARPAKYYLRGSNPRGLTSMAT